MRSVEHGFHLRLSLPERRWRFAIAPITSDEGQAVIVGALGRIKFRS